jgi:hypothetical protein
MNKEITNVKIKHGESITKIPIDTVDIGISKSESHKHLESTEELAEYSIGQIVEADDKTGMIAAVLEGEFGWPGDTNNVDQSNENIKKVDTDNDEIIMNATESDPLYVIALEEGGSILANTDEISTDASLDRDGEKIESWEDMGDDATSAELEPLYHTCDNPSNKKEWELAKKEHMYAQAKARSTEALETDTKKDTSEYSIEELLNIPGVDDPEVGFASDPNGWDRTSYLDAWASVGGTWSTCYPRMVRHFGPNQAKRWCAALKDHVLGTEEWRGDF